MKNNNNLITENKAPIEIVQELKPEYQTYEEFIETYQADEKLNESYENEFDSYDDLVIKGTSYGPGFWGDVWTVTKKVGGVAIGISYVTPAAPVAMALSAAVAVPALIAEESGTEGGKWFANEVKDVLGTAMDVNDFGGETVKAVNKYRSVTRK